MSSQPTAGQSLHGLMATCVTFMVLCTFFVALRFIARIHVKAAQLGIDDYLIIPAYVVCMGLCIDSLVVRHYEMIGNTPADVPIDQPWQFESQLKPALKSIYAAEQLLYAGFTLPKLSLLFLYLRLFDGRGIRITTWILIGITTACWIIFAFIAAFLCQPVQYYWDRLIPGGQCLDIDTFWRAIPPFNIFTDLVALILPIPTIWRLETSRMKRIGVIFIFFTGGVGLVTCCIRWGIYLTHSAANIVPSITEIELTWAVIEANMYLIAACLPMMRPILLAITPRWIGDRWTHSSGSSAYHGHAATAGSSHLSWPWRRTKHDSRFLRLGDAEGGKGRGLRPLTLSSEPKSRLSLSSPRSPGGLDLDLPLNEIDNSIQKHVEVSVEQSRLSGTSSEVELQRELHGRTHSFADAPDRAAL